jgi:hypothetical protein
MLTWLTLDGSQLSSENFSRFLQNQNHLGELRLSRVSIDESIIAGILELAKRNQIKLDLSHTSLTDEQFEAFRNASITSMNVAGTQLTDRSIDIILSISSGELNLSKTKITDKGIARLGTKGINRLTLSGLDITGAGFADWKNISFLELDLSDTLIEDQHLITLLKEIPRGDGLGGTPHMNLLNLANTNVSDAIIPQLLNVSCNKVVISGTKITAKGLANVANSTPVLKVHQFEIGPKQFTPAERTLLERAGLDIGG